MTDGGALLVAKGLEKRYDVPVIEGVDLDLRPGECHALVGENGAGKTTLVKILSGLTPASGGAMTLDGAPYRPTDRTEATARGVRTVLQELVAVETLTVAESLFLEQWPHHWGWIDREALARESRPLLDRVGLQQVAPGQPMASLGIGQRQLVEIAAASHRPCRLLLLDEPTAALTDAEAERLFEMLGELQAQGTALLYISHRLEEIRRLANRVTVLRAGRQVASKPTDAVSTEELIRLMVGRTVAEAVTRTTPSSDRPALRVRGLEAGPAVQNISFDLHWGEVLGFAGLVGAGRSETMRAVYGADTAVGGELRVDDDEDGQRFASPRQAVKRGIAMLGEDRHRQGLLGSLPVRVNVALASLGRLARRFGWMDRTAEQTAVDALIHRLRVKCTSAEQPIDRLSGGNQQTSLIARGLRREPRILIFAEPTRGIDAGARAEIHQLLAGLADSGSAVLLVSSDLRELTTLSDRIAVLSKGRLVATFKGPTFDPEAIMTAAFSSHVAPSAPPSPGRADHA